VDIIDFLCVVLCSSTIQLHDSLASRCTFACSERLISVVKMVTVLEECTNEEQCSLMRFLCGEGLNAKDIHKNIFPVYGGNY
jgi:hypothetical protein